MTDRKTTPTSSNGHRPDFGGQPFPRFQNKRDSAPGWVPVDLGGHEVVGRLHMQLKPGAEAAGEGRHALDRLEGSLERGQLDVLRLLVTELVTNSVRHADAGREWIGLDVDIYSNAVRVAVTDRGPGFEPPAEPAPHPDRPGGWGLCLLHRLADRWGVARNGTTAVWFEVDRNRRGFAAAT
jgi:anti-sigma regulatory factor (Ser/Thr protein kinase)